MSNSVVFCYVQLILTPYDRSEVSKWCVLRVTPGSFFGNTNKHIQCYSHSKLCFVSCTHWFEFGHVFITKNKTIAELTKETFFSLFLFTKLTYHESMSSRWDFNFGGLWLQMQIESKRFVFKNWHKDVLWISLNYNFTNFLWFFHHSSIEHISSKYLWMTWKSMCISWIISKKSRRLKERWRKEEMKTERWEKNDGETKR